MTTFLKKDGGLVGLNSKLLKKVAASVPADHMPHVREALTDNSGQPLEDESGNPLRKWRPYVYNDATVQSMLTPAAYSAGTYPYGWCVTDGGNTYQVNNYSGTSEALEHADWDDLGAGAYFVPVATHQDLNNVRAAITKTWGAGTPFEGTYVGEGLAGNYIQVSDIDLYDECRTGGAYYNSGAGWSKIDSFAGVMDFGARIVNGLYMFTSSANAGLFGEGAGVVRNGAFLNCYASGTQVSLANLYGGLRTGGVIINCIVAGVLHGTARYRGGICAINFDGTISNCASFVSVVGTGNDYGSAIGQIRVAVENLFSTGSVIGGSSLGGLIGGNPYSKTVTASYYNTETSGQSDTGKGVPKTTAELLAGEPSAGIYTDWDTRIWKFVPGRYPIHKFFGELPVNIPPPTNLQTAISGSDVVLTWDDYTGAPKPLGYFVYQSIDNGAWTKLNETALTDMTYTVASPAVGSHNFFVTAQYKRRYTGETGNSVTTLETIT